MLDVGVEALVNKKAAQGIINYREGADGALGTADDRWFATMAALDAVKQMTESAWHSLRALSRMLDERGMRNRSGKPFSASSVRRMVATVGKVVA